MCISTDGKVCIILDLHLYHSCLVIDNLLDCQDDLIDVFLVDLLSILEPFQHIPYEVRSHVLFQPSPVIVGFNNHRVQVQTLCRRWLISRVNSLKEGNSLDNLLALCQLELSILVVRRFPDDRLEVPECIFSFQNCSIGNCPAVVGLHGSQLLEHLPSYKREATYLDEVWIELNCLCSICNRIPIRFGLDVCLSIPNQSREQVFCSPSTYLRPVGIICRLLVVQLYGLGVEINSGRPVVRSKGFVAIVLEGDSLLLGGSHGWMVARRGMAGRIALERVHKEYRTRQISVWAVIGWLAGWLFGWECTQWESASRE